MMPGESTLTFKASELVPHVRHVLTAKTHGNKGAGLMLVKDEGVYLMSGSYPTEDRPPVVYAKGMNPTLNPDYYERARDMLGGDDFADFLPIDAFGAVLTDPVTSIEVGVTETAIEVRLIDET